jgi:hypothetical protein
MKSIIVLVAMLGMVNAACDNACSGHGTCGVHGVCKCYDNWGLGLSHDSGDCSERICPFEFAWVDTPDSKGYHHKYAECAAKGICNRESGECECFPGYEGKGCQRTACPNDCSGHGQCAYIANLEFPATEHDDDKTDAGTVLWHKVGLTGGKTFTYHMWDNMKTRGCVCDPQYGDVDCSKRMCPYGNDVMDIRQDNTDGLPRYQTQSITLTSPDTDSSGTTLDGYAAKTFALTFTSKLNETFTTIPIILQDATGNEQVNFHDMLMDVERALENLPNRVIDNVVVSGIRLDSGGSEVSGNATSSHAIRLNVTFVGDMVQGAQNLLQVETTECLDGCTPKITGLELVPGSQTNWVVDDTFYESTDFNSFECGRRGKCDYGTGTCTCFAGYTGVNCNTITALV